MFILSMQIVLKNFIQISESTDYVSILKSLKTINFYFNAFANVANQNFQKNCIPNKQNLGIFYIKLKKCYFWFM